MLWCLYNDNRTHWTADVFIAGSVDELNSPSARLTVGRVMKAGTGCFDVVIPVNV